VRRKYESSLLHLRHPSLLAVRLFFSLPCPSTSSHILLNAHYIHRSRDHQYHLRIPIIPPKQEDMLFLSHAICWQQKKHQRPSSHSGALAMCKSRSSQIFRFGDRTAVPTRPDGIVLITPRQAHVIVDMYHCEVRLANLNMWVGCR
jgi:hypothetical protein